MMPVSHAAVLLIVTGQVKKRNGSEILAAPFEGQNTDVKAMHGRKRVKVKFWGDNNWSCCYFDQSMLPVVHRVRRSRLVWSHLLAFERHPSSLKSEIKAKTSVRPPSNIWNQLDYIPSLINSTHHLPINYYRVDLFPYSNNFSHNWTSVMFH